MKKISALLLLILLAVPAAAQAKIVIASGAGYRSLVDKLTATYTDQTGNEVERVYGNMARVTAQARNSGSVDLVLGDKSFLEKSKLDCCATQKVGRGGWLSLIPKAKALTVQTTFLQKTFHVLLCPIPSGPFTEKQHNNT